MINLGILPLWALAIHLAVELALIARVLLKPYRDPAARVAWLVVLIALPVAGIIVYLLLGETSIGRRYTQRMRTVLEQLPAPASVTTVHTPDARVQHLFEMVTSINGFMPCAGNHFEFPDGADATIDALVADIDAARRHVHLLFYIWLTDRNGLRVVAAIERAAARGVTCRVMVDAVGSRGLIKSKYWRAMQDAGASTAVALPVGNPALHVFVGRVDLRNHRKIVVIDNEITYAGSQNCADAAFAIKKKYAPWVDAVIRLAGPIARQNQYLFVADWMTYAGEDCRHCLDEPAPAARGDIVAQAIGTGPTGRYSAAPELLCALVYAARSQLTITTPYFVPDDALLLALCSAAYRGIDVCMVFPARNDSRIVAAASRSYYQELLAAGVHIFEYEPGLLHAKTLTVDDELTLIGSTNLDRRSFDLNYENNVLLQSRDVTAAIRARQARFIDDSHPVTLVDLKRVSAPRQAWRNALAMLGPVL
ncbi:cardiolipin synthase [Salinisphaera hydrothermalis]|uniref:Cardiolipin synthase n=1 Tax=Salinisphaera hydrothermalis (strain C41B8) TaxID=1304275 RepID=A0A084IMG9_SALHC|nr:cardiolipin synthase [Salinisphaera hydrothermalis]KEZ77903.1 phosphatidylserine/phosphatidylglycerophosphate/cardiolipin synthase [Salinisphaera hydrothermalis C41B8]